MKISLTISKRKGFILNFFLGTTVFVTLREKNFFLIFMVLELKFFWVYISTNIIYNTNHQGKTQEKYNLPYTVLKWYNYN